MVTRKEDAERLLQHAQAGEIDRLKAVTEDELGLKFRHVFSFDASQPFARLYDLRTSALLAGTYVLMNQDEVARLGVRVSEHETFKKFGEAERVLSFKVDSGDQLKSRRGGSGPERLILVNNAQHRSVTGR